MSLEALARAHRCAADCPHCAAVAEEHGLPRLSRYRDWVMSEDAVLMARLAKDYGLPYPQLHNDPTTDYLIKQAMAVNLMRIESEAAREREDRQALARAEADNKRALHDALRAAR